MKTCSACNEEKPLSEYYNSLSYKDGKGYRCKDCDRIARRDYDRRHRKQRLANQRKANRLFKYGLSNEQFLRMLSDQNNSCKICGVTIEELEGLFPKENRLCVDHDHITGKVRAMLCHRCNRGLGHFNDDAVLLQKAVDYLKEY